MRHEDREEEELSWAEMWLIGFCAAIFWLVVLFVSAL